MIIDGGNYRKSIITGVVAVMIILTGGQHRLRRSVDRTLSARTTSCVVRAVVYSDDGPWQLAEP